MLAKELQFLPAENIDFRFGESGVELLRVNIGVGMVIKMALVHDLAEAVVGDITPYDGISKV